jgi:hypothetical protein
MADEDPPALEERAHFAIKHSGIPEHVPMHTKHAVVRAVVDQGVTRLRWAEHWGLKLREIQDLRCLIKSNEGHIDLHWG